MPGEIWVPHCIAVEENIIRVYDPELHQAVNVANPSLWSIDRRWVKVRRPLIIGGGEMTLESFDLIYNPSLRYYEGPLHLKANGGMFLIDDFGRQRVDPHELLNRWIIPLENRIDYLTLHTGKKIQVPFLLSVIIATNTQVAAAYLVAFGNNGGVQGNTYVQTFAVALAVYATDPTLGGGSASTTQGFKVVNGGTGSETYNIGSNGAAFGVANNTSLTVLQILQILNADYNATTGLFYAGSSTLTNDANNVTNGINQGGDIS